MTQEGVAEQRSAAECWRRTCADATPAGTTMNDSRHPHDEVVPRPRRTAVSSAGSHEGNSLHQAGHPPPETVGALHPHIEPCRVVEAQDAIALLATHPSFRPYVKALIADERDELRRRSVEPPFDGPRTDALLKRLAFLDIAIVECETWLRERSPGELGPVRGAVGAWLAAPVEAPSGERPTGSGPAAEPDDRPAELAVALAAATQQRTDPHQGQFQPLFGVRPDARWLRDAPGHDPMPAPALRHLHQPGLFQSAWRRVVDAIRDPVQVRTDEAGLRHVHVLRSAVFSYAADGTLSGTLWMPNSLLDPTLEPCADATMTIDGVPWRWLWLQRWQRAFLFEVVSAADRQRVSVRRVDVEAYVEWAFGVFRSRIRRGFDLRAMRRSVAAALPLDPLALDVARLLCLTERRSRATVAMYNRARWHLDAHRKLVHDAPRLQLAWALLCHGADERVAGEAAGDEPLQRLRRRLKAHGLSGRLWRLLLGSGTALWRPMVWFYRQGDSQAAWDYLSLLDRLGWCGQPEAAFMQALLAQYGSGYQRARSYDHRYAKHTTVLRAIAQRYEAQDAGGRHEVCAELQRILTWLGRDRVVTARAALHPPPWRSLVRRAREYETRQLRLTDAVQGPWPQPAIEGDLGPYDLRPLGTAAELHEEGEAMRHCALAFAQDCARGSAAVASVRDRNSGRRVASVLWRRTAHGWLLEEVVGFANRPAPDQVCRSIQSLVVVDGRPERRRDTDVRPE